jgi:hypothetical protein
MASDKYIDDSPSLFIRKNVEEDAELSLFS